MLSLKFPFLLQQKFLQELDKTKYYNYFMKKYGFYNNVGIFLVSGHKIVGLVDFISEKNEKQTIDELMSLEILSRYLAQRLEENKQGNTKELNLPIQINLTEREKEVLGVVMQGYSNMEIANELFISVDTVKKHLHSLYSKFNVNNRTSLSYKINYLI